MYQVSSAVPRFAYALLMGAALATAWVNLAPASYYDAIEWRPLDLTLPDWLLPGPLRLTPFALVAEALMALFVFLIGKELWEALVLDRGALRGGRAVLPLMLVVGGLAGAVGVWVLAAPLSADAASAAGATGLAPGWQLVLGSDAVLVFLAARALFGQGHPVLHLLLLVAIATDLLALVIMGLTLPMAPLRLVWLALPAVAALAVWRFWGRAPAPGAPERARRARDRLWPYVLAGGLSWVGVVAAGLPGALGLLPVIPAIAHSDRSFGLFAEMETLLHDPLNRLAHALVWPVTVTLFLFGLTRGGVDLAAFGPTTVAVLAALWLGRPVGMLVLGLGAAAMLGLRLPNGVTLRDVMIGAGLLAMGFTVPVLALDSVLPGGLMAEAARLGLALGLLAGPALVLALRRRQAAQ